MMQISNKVGYLIIAIVVIVLVGYFWMKQSKKTEIPPGAQIGQPARREGSETGMMGRGAEEGVLEEEGGIILHLPR
ncbi:MAG: hypothetical protein V2G42_08080 [bacterium JZ-2024 1]